MRDIVRGILSKLRVLQNQWVLVSVVTVVVLVVVVVLVLIVLKKRKSKRQVSDELPEGTEDSTSQSQLNYEPIIKQVKQLKKKYKVILFASNDIDGLPVTIPTNVAIQLAKDKKRCLLIDLDFKRNAIAAVFGFNGEPNCPRPRALRTQFENLWLWPGHHFTKVKQMNVDMIVEKAMERFDYILMNAPALISSADRRQIVSAAQAAFIFSKDSISITKLTELIESTDCKLISNIKIP